MSDVSNARRVGFTVLALLVFVFFVRLAYRDTLVYWQEVGLGPGSSSAPVRSNGSPAGTFGMMLLAWRHILWWRILWVVPSLALLPSLLLAMSEHNSLSRALRDPRLLVTSGLITCSIAFAALLGDQNGVPLLESRRVPVLWLLPPIVLTTAFVIFGAWRRAVRDADVEAVEEGE